MENTNLGKEYFYQQDEDLKLSLKKMQSFKPSKFLFKSQSLRKILASKYFFLASNIKRKQAEYSFGKKFFGLFQYSLGEAEISS